MEMCILNAALIVYHSHARCRDERYWTYEYSADLPHPHTRILFKSNVGTAEFAEYGPWLDPAAGSLFHPTDKRGVAFITLIPNVSTTKPACGRSSKRETRATNKKKGRQDADQRSEPATGTQQVDLTGD